MRSLFSYILPLLLVSAIFAQQKITEFHAGILMPNSASNGFIGGIASGRAIDEQLAWLIEVDYYGKSYTEETEVPQQDQGEIQPKLVTTMIDNTTTMIPLYFKLSYNTRLSPAIDLKFGAGIGYEFMWNSETNYEKKVDETRFYSGFTWQAGAGLAFPISRSGDLFAEVSYHAGSPSRGEGENAEGLPVRTEVDMSGIMIRGGIRIYDFGLF